MLRLVGKYSSSSIKGLLTDQIRSCLKPIKLEIEDESRFHQRGTETHFKILIVSDRFEGLSKVRKQQLVY